LTRFFWKFFDPLETHSSANGGRASPVDAAAR
jgi:hypothetical protein